MREESAESSRLLGAVASGDASALAGRFALREAGPDETGLDLRTIGLVKIAALIALDAPPATYASQVALALEGGASADDVVGVLRSVAVLVGVPRVVAAAPEIMLALGLPLPGDP